MTRNKPPKPKAKSLDGFGFTPVDRQVRPLGSDARNSGWCYRCGTGHLWSEQCKEERHD